MKDGDKNKTAKVNNTASSTEQPASTEQADAVRAKTVLIVAYHFPPAAGQALPGTQRAVKLIRYLPDFGWSACVLTVKQSEYPHYIELNQQSLDALPKDLPVERTSTTRLLRVLIRIRNAAKRLLARIFGDKVVASKPYYVDGHKRKVQSVKDSVTELFEIPDEVSGWIISATLGGRRMAKAHAYDAIIATGRPWSSLVVGSLLSRFTGRPLISDFRDPWMTNPFRADHSKLKNKLDGRLERYVIRQSSLVIANTDLLRDEFAERYSDLPGDRFVAIPNGFDAKEIGPCLEAAAAATNPSQFTLVHAGFLYGKRDPRVLIDALRALLDREQELTGKLKIVLAGPRDLPYSICQYIVETGLSDCVQIVDAVPFEESLAMVARSSAAILLQPDTLTQVPSKLFENIGLGKMTIAIADADSATERLFKAHRIGYFADSVDKEEIADAIQNAYRDWKASGGLLGIAPDVKAQFDIRTRVGSIAEHLERLTRNERDAAS
jgi:glycosyltransferase involved in cell wall biosynthesis